MKQPAQKSDLVIGVDVGGTKVAAGLVDGGGEIRKLVRVPMVANSSPQEGVGAVHSAIRALLQDAPQTVVGIGICSPGPLDPKTGVVINPPNLPCWRNFPLGPEVAAIYNLPVRVDNDANAAALAEARWGAGRGYHTVFYATIGTGIGTGVIFDGKIYHGRTGAAAEGGHVSIDYNGPRCGCGKKGCMEALASGPAIARRAQARLRNDPGRKSLMLDLASGNPELVTGEIVGQAYAAGDHLATEVLQEIAALLAVWLGNMIDLFEPDVMIIGGGASSLVIPFFGEIRSLLPQWCVNPRFQEIPLVEARYGADSGVAGGAALCSGVLNPT